jgi:hypothetical protein
MEIEDDPSFEVKSEKTSTFTAFLIIVGLFIGNLEILGD